MVVGIGDDDATMMLVDRNFLPADEVDTSWPRESSARQERLVAQRQ